MQRVCRHESDEVSVALAEVCLVGEEFLTVLGDFVEEYGGNTRGDLDYAGDDLLAQVRR
jgi:hypothetical protein